MILVGICIKGCLLIIPASHCNKAEVVDLLGNTVKLNMSLVKKFSHQICQDSTLPGFSCMINIYITLLISFQGKKISCPRSM